MEIARHWSQMLQRNWPAADQQLLIVLENKLPIAMVVDQGGSIWEDACDGRYVIFKVGTMSAKWEEQIEIAERMNLIGRR